MRYAIMYGEEHLSTLTCNGGMTDEEICEACGIELATTQEEYEHAPENGMYALDSLTIIAVNEIWTACRETGTRIEQCDTVDEAKQLIDRYEEDDMNNNHYTPEYYDIINEDYESILY